MMTRCYPQGGVDVRVARIFNTFGPRMHPHDGRVVSNFIIQAMKNSPITIYGDGSQTRSFQYVEVWCLDYSWPIRKFLFSAH
jgi:UDP-glucuronate decarboxylase